MDCSKLSFCDASAGIFLREDARSIRKAVYDGGVELPKHKPQSFFQLIVNDHVLVRAEQPVR